MPSRGSPGALRIAGSPKRKIIGDWAPQGTRQGRHVLPEGENRRLSQTDCHWTCKPRGLRDGTSRGYLAQKSRSEDFSPRLLLFYVRNYFFSTRMDSMVTGVVVLPDGSVSRLLILSAMSIPSMTLPNTVCFPVR